MKPFLRRAVKNYHVWSGVSVGLLFCVMGLTGSVLVYRHQIESALRPDWKAQTAARPASPISEAEHNVHTRWPNAAVQRLVLPESANGPLEFAIQEGKQQTGVFCDPVTGEVLGVFQVRWLDWIVALHHNLRLGPVGRQLVGVIGIALLLASASGLALWLRRGVLRDRSWKGGLHIDWRRAKVRNLQSHRATGLVANLFLLLQALTGITLGFPQTWRTAVEAVTGWRAARPPRVKVEKGLPQPLEVLLAAALKQVPGGQGRELRFGQNGNSPVSIRIWHEGDFRPEGSNQVTLNPVTAAVISVDRSTEWSIGRRLEMTPASLHFAEWGGGAIKALWFLVGLTPTVLFVSGIAIWWTGTKARRYTAQRQIKRELTSA